MHYCQQQFVSTAYAHDLKNRVKRYGYNFCRYRPYVYRDNLGKLSAFHQDNLIRSKKIANQYFRSGIEVSDFTACDYTDFLA